ncbi:MAG: glycosyltransferase family 4 protein [Leptospiraceae bacterium]|nr:glycosyltransferase family 4 protein [Leptospiraceae bacterium]
MKIGLGTLFLYPEKLGGLENYTRGLIYGLSKVDEKNEYTILANRENYSTWKDLPKNFKIYLCPVSASKKLKRTLYEKYHLKKVLKSLGINLYHSLAFGFFPILKDIRIVITVGDIIFKRYPEDLGLVQRLAMDYSVKYACNYAHQILTFSEYSKKDLLEVYRVSQEKVNVSLLSNNTFKSDANKVDIYFRENQLPEKYIYSVVSTYYHKNLKGLLEAFSILKREKKIPHSLVISGLKMAGHGKFFDLISSYGLEDSVVFTGWVPEEVLSGLYQKASCFIYPSFYEGFGLPILEAMVNGVAVVSSNATSLPEVYGEAALTFDPSNTKDMVQKIYDCISDESLKNSLIQKGYQHSKTYSWEECARQTLLTYQKAIS